jgi:hypothetical protein
MDSLWYLMFFYFAVILFLIKRLEEKHMLLQAKIKETEILRKKLGMMIEEEKEPILGKVIGAFLILKLRQAGRKVIERMTIEVNSGYTKNEYQNEFESREFNL